MLADGAVEDWVKSIFTWQIARRRAIRMKDDVFAELVDTRVVDYVSALCEIS